MNKALICVRSLVITLFAITAANSFCMMKETENKYAEEERKCYKDNKIFITIRNNLREEIKNQIENNKENGNLLLSGAKPGTFTNLATPSHNLSLLLSHEEPGTFTNLLTKFSPHLSFLGGITIFKCVSQYASEDAKGVVLGAAAAFLGFTGMGWLSHKFFGSRVEEYKIKKAEIAGYSYAHDVIKKLPTLQKVNPEE